jgi:hypothetical protein
MRCEGGRGEAARAARTLAAPARGGASSRAQLQWALLPRTVAVILASALPAAAAAAAVIPAAAAAAAATAPVAVELVRVAAAVPAAAPAPAAAPEAAAPAAPAAPASPASPAAADEVVPGGRHAHLRAVGVGWLGGCVMCGGGDRAGAVAGVAASLGAAVHIRPRHPTTHPRLQPPRLQAPTSACCQQPPTLPSSSSSSSSPNTATHPLQPPTPQIPRHHPHQRTSCR